MLYMFHIPTTIGRRLQGFNYVIHVSHTTIGRRLQGFNYVIHVSHTYHYREAVTGV